MRRRCDCNDEVEVCKCWGWRKDFPDFYERISTIFPNLSYDVVEKGRMNERLAKIEKIKQLAVNLGIFNDETCFFKDFDAILGFKKET